MSWRDRLSLAWRFITWRTRINRVQFIIGYFAGAVGGTIFAFVVLSILLTLNPQTLSAGFDGMQSLKPIFIPMLIYMAGLLAARAHDCGWPAWPIVVLWALALGVVQILGGFAFGSPNDPVRQAVQELPPSVLNALPLLAVILPWISMIALAVTPGQQKDNKFGSPQRGLGF